MANEYLDDAREWLSFAEADLGVAMRYPNELFLEDRHAEKAIQMANEFVKWAKLNLDEAENPE